MQSIKPSQHKKIHILLKDFTFTADSTSGPLNFSRIFN
uniref:Uncharacterized protein n=1 Tax=Rhizophora mucronata TaxID=61149 RepID=A0A2P2KRB3_RHIMU